MHVRVLTPGAMCSAVISTEVLYLMNTTKWTAQCNSENAHKHICMYTHFEHQMMNTKWSDLMLQWTSCDKHNYSSGGKSCLLVDLMLFPPPKPNIILGLMRVVAVVS